MKNIASKSRYRYKRRHMVTNESSGVSEAVGTIMLLAIAMILIAVVATWVQTIPQLPEQKKANFLVTYELTDTEIIVDIMHQGGDSLDVYETTIHLKLSYPGYQEYIFELSESTLASMADGTWSIGEHWNYTLVTLSENAEVNIKIIDINVDRILFTEDRLFGKLDENLPDFEISADNITFTWSGQFIRKNKPVKISAVIYNRGRANATAIVRFFDGNRLITEGGFQYRTVKIPYKYSQSAKNYEQVDTAWIPDRWGEHEISVKIYSLEFETNYANNFASKDVNVEVSFEPPKGADLTLSEFDINPSTNYPIHGSDLNLSIIIHNIGDLPIVPGDNFNVSVLLGEREIIKTITQGVRARDSIQFYTLFTEVGPGEPMTITVHIDPDNATRETDKFNNIATKNIQIIPTILIVDDDGADSGKENVANALMKSFIGRGITYDYYQVTGDHDVNPRYDAGPKKLKNFDIVIWITGYRNNKTLTAMNQQHLEIWLNDNQTTNRLWIIGQDILNETVQTPGTVNTTDFAYKYLGVKDYNWNCTPEILLGTPGDMITDGMVLNTSGYVPNKDRGLNFELRPSTVNASIKSILSNETELGIDTSMAIRYHNLSAAYKVVFFSFEFTSISAPYDLSNVSYHVLKWFNYTLKEGYDFGIVDQSFSIIDPEYMDIITISATVVNNGPNNEDVDVAFYVTDPNGFESRIIEYPDNKDNPQRIINLSGNGGREIVTKQWLAVSVGQHDFRVMVDPNDRFQEIVEENNDFSYYGLEVTRLEIQYTILVVDDDNSTNNGGVYPDTVTPVINTLDNMSYYYRTHLVTGGATPDNGPDLEKLKHYNTVIWLTGADPGPTLTTDDQVSLIDYIEGNYVEAAYIQSKVNLLLVGQNILDDLNGSGDNIQPDKGFIRDYLKITEYSTSKSLPNEMEGVTNNAISHGSNYPIVTTFTDNADVVISSDQDNYLFYRNKVQNTYNSIYYDHERNHSRVVFLAWELSFIDDTDLVGYPGENYRYEFIYLVLNRFQYPRDIVELKISNIDIIISEEHPNVGQSYLINTDVFNYGNLDCSTIVRFYDGETIIDTDTIYVPPQGRASAEIIWVPLYAGNRTITIFVDIDDDVTEQFESLNNDASIPNTWVYFFHDDMEDGPVNWHHESTIIRINGESPLEYFDDKVYMNIVENWDQVDGFEENTSFYHSANTSFYASEPAGFTGAANILLALVIDTSISMQTRTDSFGVSWLDRAKQAAKYLVGRLSDISNVSVWHVDKNQNDRRQLGFTLLGNGGRTTVNNHIDDLWSNSGHTILWDVIGEAYLETVAANLTNPGLIPAVVVLSDGSDYASSDTSSFQWNKMEAGSNTWCPWHNVSAGILPHPDHKGKYRNFDTNQDIWHTVGGGSYVANRRGLLNADIRIYTIGLGLEHHTPPNEPSKSAWVEDQVDNNAYYTNGVESGTLEYNLWRISTTSNASYFYAPTSDQLKNIFAQIAKELNALLSRSVRSSDSTRAADIGAETKSALTGNFSLINVTSARLTFYHKYWLTEGYNGALIRVGTVNASGGWEFKYIQPTKLYTGNLYLDRSELDDFGNRMLWCWNGVSGDGLFEWEYAEFDLSEFIGKPGVRINFTLVLYGGGTGGGWWVDDVEVKVTRDDALAVTSETRDQWQLTTSAAHSGQYSWWNGNPSTNYLTGGIDNSLTTRSIDMINARNATLSAYFRFNINSESGLPPDGFRIEISSDNGISWKAVNLGVRSAWGVSGNDGDGSDGIPNDGKSYTGINSGANWVEAGSLTRLNCDLSGWAGKVIKMRFRVITASDSNPFYGNAHYQSPTAGFGGFFVDDVIIHGFSLQE